MANFIFATGDSEYLKDDVGDRRFFPISIKPSRTLSIEESCVPGSEHWFDGAICIICGKDAPKLPSCANCRFSHENGRDTGRLACGAQVDDDALAGQEQSALGKMLGTKGINPIWATRKYSAEGILKMLACRDDKLDGFDCNNLSPDDGRDCAAFEWKTGG